MAPHGSPYRGRPRDRSLEGVIVPAFGRAQDWTQPWEDPDDGCPGAWYRTPYVDTVDEFTREHGQTPWQTGPFDAANNLIDHLIALGDSQRQAGRGQTVDWGGLYYNRYAAPTFTPGAPPNPRGDEPWQRLAPGQMANPLHPWWLMQGAMGNPGWYAGIRRPWFGG